MHQRDHILGLTCTEEREGEEEKVDEGIEEEIDVRAEQWRQGR
jgi:hypothetical protein